ncbi:MAG: hypothetical protein ACLFR1_06590 [Spirochaetia bacterium]
MKKNIVTVLLILFTFSLFAQESEEVQEVVVMPMYITVGQSDFLQEENRIRANMALGIIMSSVYEVDGLQASCIMNFCESDMNGLQGAYIGNHVGGDVNGFQGASVYNIAEGNVSGGQAAGVFNIAEGEVNFVQSSGVFNIAEGGVFGAQFAGVFNIAEGTVSGAQCSGVFNIAENVNGTQCSGIFNVAENVIGLQSGLVNIGADVSGTQVGLVNICDDISGFPIGLVNIIRNGISDPCVWMDDTGFTYVGFQHGGRNWYTLYYGGAENEDYFNSAESLAAGIGFGIRMRSGLLYVDTDLSIKQQVPDVWGLSLEEIKAMDIQQQYIPSVRLSGGIELGNLGIFGGVTFDTHAGDWADASCVQFNGTEHEINLFDNRFNVYQKLFFGIHI